MSELLDKANRLHKKGKLLQADKLYLRVLKSNPKDASALHMRAVLKMQTGNTDYAIQLLKASLQVATSDPWVHYHLGECFRLTRNFRAAEEHLIAAQSMGLDDPDLHFCLAEVQAASGKFDQAINCYETALRASPQDLQIAQSYASVLHQAGRATEATQLLQKTLLQKNIQTDPTSHNNLILQMIEIASSFDTADTLQTYIDNLLALQNQHSPEILIDALGGLLEHKQLYAMNSLVSLLPSSTQKLAEVQLLLARYYGLKSDRKEAIAVYTDLFANTATPSQVRTRTIRDLVQMDEVAVVNQLAGRFDLSSRCDLAVLHQLTGSLIDLGQFQTAENILDTCKNTDLKQAPMTAFHHGICAQVAGDFKSASLHHREAIQRDNHLGTAAYALASIGSSSITDDELEAWKLLLTSEDVPDNQQAYFQFAVARVLDSREQYASAYEYYLKGNEMMSRLQPFDSEAWSETIDAVIETYDTAFFDKMRSSFALSDVVDTDESQVFIVGMPRSGSTLLEREICRHFGAQGLGEHIEMRRIFGRVAEISSSQSGIRAANELSADHIKMFRQAYLASLPEKHSAVVVDKMLGNILRLGLIAILFPEARAIYCDRSLEATAVSCFTNVFSQGLQFTYSLDAIRLVWNDCQRLVNHWQKVLPIPFQSIKYDDLVRYPDKTMQSIESTLQLKQINKPQDVSNLDDHAMHTASFWQARQPTYTSSIEHWRRFQIEF